MKDQKDISFPSHTEWNILSVIKYCTFQYSSINMKILFLSSSILSLFLFLSHFLLSSKKMKASSIFHVHTCEYPLRKQIIIIIRRELEDKLMREQRERREEQTNVRLTV